MSGRGSVLNSCQRTELHVLVSLCKRTFRGLKRGFVLNASNYSSEKGLVKGEREREGKKKEFGYFNFLFYYFGS